MAGTDKTKNQVLGPAPVAVLAKAGLSGTTAAMLKPGVLVAKAGVTAP